MFVTYIFVISAGSVKLSCLFPELGITRPGYMDSAFDSVCKVSAILNFRILIENYLGGLN